MKQIRKEETLNTGLRFDSVQDVSDNIYISLPEYQMR